MNSSNPSNDLVNCKLQVWFI